MIILYTGPMKSGKSEAIIKFREKLYENNIECMGFKPSIDTRDKDIRSRNGTSAKAIEIKSFKDIRNEVELKNLDNIIIDEIQFISLEGLEEFVRYVQVNDVNVIASGLNLSSDFKPFETTSKFSMYCDCIVVLYGVCKCGDKSKLTYCKVDKSEEILIGDSVYESKCYKCYK